LKIPGVKQIAFAGSLRRGKETIGDLDIIVATDDPAPVSEAFRTMPEVEQVLAAGPTKSSVRVNVGAASGRRKQSAVLGCQSDLRVVAPQSWGAALMYFTGSKEHNVALRERALKRGLTLNEYGLFPDDKKDTPPQTRGVKPVAGATEEEIYKALGMPYIPPEIREHHGEIALDRTPRLVELGDIKAELHAHTTASDGRLSITELAMLAKLRGFHTIAVTDHSKSSPIAGGLSPDRLRQHITAVREANEQARASGWGVTILAGSEVDILADGRLDYDDDLLAQLDIVVASPHAALSQDPAVATARLLKAIRHPSVNILAHPTGRLVNKRAGLSLAMNELVAAAKEHAVALEINAHWLRLDLRDVHVRAAVDADCVIAIDCDVHEPADFDNLRYGVLTARRGWLTPGACINSWPAEKLHGWLKAKN
jgi:DNA polymerase (family 10)